MTLRESADAATGNHHYAVVMIDTDTCPLARDELMETLWAENVRARRYFFPGCHRMEPYASRAPGLQALLPVTDDVAAQVLILPASSGVTIEEAEMISCRIRIAVSQHDRIRKKMHGTRRN